MDAFEKIIRENSGFFDHREPDPGHFDRFRQKLGMEETKRKKISLSRIMQAAAVLLLLVISSLWVYEHFLQAREPRAISLGSLSPEYREVEMYYTSMIQEKYREFEALSSDSLAMQILHQEMQSMDSTNLSLQRELAANPGDERVVNAIIELYETKVKVMNYILGQLKEVEQVKHEHSKPSTYESPEI